MFTAAVDAAKGMSRWEITHADDKDLSVEGVATTFFLRFKVSGPLDMGWLHGCI